MTETSDHSAGSFGRAALPYAAVVLGLFGLHSGWAAILLYHAGILLFWFAGRRPLPFASLFAGARTRSLLPAAIVCALAGPVLVLLWPWLRSSEGILPTWLAAQGLTGWRWSLFVIYFATVHPLLEELHWRSLTGGMLARITWSDLAFAGYHLLVLYPLLKWPWLLVVFATLVLSSLFWRIAAARSRGIAVPVITHAIADTSIMAAAFYLSRSG